MTVTAVATTAALVSTCDAILQPDRFRDYGPNGLQVGNSGRVGRVASAATASLAACERAREGGCTALIVHHGLLWGSVSPITGPLRRRLACLLEADIALLAYHLPLDAHREFGNNAIALRRLGMEPVATFAPYKGSDIGWWGDTGGIPIGDLILRCTEAFRHKVIHCPGSGDPIERVGVVTGGGQSTLLAAAEAGLDALVTGETSEQSWHEAAESGCHLLACGHHATENIAVHTLAGRVANDLGIDHLALDDLVNPL